MSYKKVGDVQVAQGDLADALHPIRRTSPSRNWLAKADPGNAGWQRDLSAAYSKLASVFSKTGPSDKAREALMAGRAILTELIARHPDWAEWKRDAAWFDKQLDQLQQRR